MGGSDILYDEQKVERLRPHRLRPLCQWQCGRMEPLLPHNICHSASLSHCRCQPGAPARSTSRSHSSAPAYGESSRQISSSSYVASSTRNAGVSSYVDIGACRSSSSSSSPGFAITNYHSSPIRPTSVNFGTPHLYARNTLSRYTALGVASQHSTDATPAVQYASCAHTDADGDGVCDNGCGATVIGFGDQSGNAGGVLDPNDFVWKEPLGDAILPLLLFAALYILRLGGLTFLSVPTRMKI